MHSSISSSRLWIWFAATVAAGLLGFVALLGASEFVVRYRVEPKDHFWRNVAVFFSSKSENVVLGDSIAARGFHGAPGFVNLALPGEPPILTELKLAAYFRSTRPNKVIVSLNPNIFRRSSNINLKQYREIYLSPKEPLLKIFKQRHKDRMLGYWLIWLSGREFESNVTVPSEGGILLRNPAENSEYANRREEVRLEEATKNVSRDLISEKFKGHENLKIIARIVEFVRSKGGEICLVEFPYAPEYRRATQQFPRFEEARKFLREFAESTGAHYVDFWDRYDDAKFFLDPSHLNEAGARDFAPQAVRECFGVTSGLSSSN